MEASPSAYCGGMLALGTTTSEGGGDLRRFYTPQHQLYCGIDLHARTMCVCILNQDGEIVAHRHMQTSLDTLLQIMASSRDDLVMAAECIFTWNLAGGPVRPRGHPLRARTRPRHEHHSRRQGETRQNRCAQDGGVAPRWHAPAGLRLSRCHAGHPRSPPPSDASHAHTSGTPGSYPEYHCPGRSCHGGVDAHASRIDAVVRAPCGSCGPVPTGVHGRGGMVAPGPGGGGSRRRTRPAYCSRAGGPSWPS
jgi:hypothetical protein